MRLQAVRRPSRSHGGTPPIPPAERGGARRRTGAAACGWLAVALLTALAAGVACSPGSAKTRPAATIAPRDGPAAGSTPIATDDIPASFLAGEPQSAPAGERIQLFSPPPARPRATPATPQPTPDIARIAADAGFPLYALSAPRAEFAPVQLRESTAPEPAGRGVSLLAVQYRQPAAAGGGLVIVQSSPGAGAVPARDDLDDALDAVRLHSRLAGTPAAGDPLADPAAALATLGCPVHTALSVQIEGQARRADLVSWPGAPEVLLLRVEAGATEVVIEAGRLSRAALLALPPRLAALQRTPALAGSLQSVFSGAASAPRAAPAAPPHKGTPTH